MANSRRLIWHVEDDGKPNFEKFGRFEIFRPRPLSEVKLRIDAEKHLRQRYSEGIYRDGIQVNEILQYRFDFFNSEFSRLLPQVASIDFLFFVLDQFDQSHEVAERFKRFELSAREMARWNDLGSWLRRSIKYLAESVVLTNPGPDPLTVDDQLLDITDRCWSCCEQALKLSSLSAQTFALFPESTTLTISAEGEHEYINLEIDEPKRFAEFDERVRREALARSRYIDDHAFALNVDRGKDLLDSAFQTSLGFKLSGAWSYMAMVMQNAIPAPGNFPIPFVLKQMVADGLVEDLKLSVEVANRLLSGFTITREAMQREVRRVWKTKQEYRALARPLMEVPHHLGPHLIWSKAMAKECLIIFWKNLAFRKLPAEWTTDATKLAVEEYGASLNRDFEKIICTNLRSQRLHANRFTKSIGNGAHRLVIPNNVGELDCVAYSESHRLLVLIEGKMIRDTNEPVTFRDDVDKFLTSSDCYLSQLRAKANWVSGNLPNIALALASEPDFPKQVTIQRFLPMFVTYYPTVASLFFDEFPCVSIVQLMEDYCIPGKWA
jgi:hypothetical protein